MSPITQAAAIEVDGAPRGFHVIAPESATTPALMENNAAWLATLLGVERRDHDRGQGAQ